MHIVRCDASTIAAELAPFGLTAATGIPAWLGKCLDLPATPGSVPPLDGLDRDVLRQLALPHACHTLPAAAPAVPS